MASNRKHFWAAGRLLWFTRKEDLKESFTVELSPAMSAEVHLCLTLLRDTNKTPAGILGFSIEVAGNKLAGNVHSPAQAAVAPGAVPLARREIDGTQFLIASPLMHKFMGMVDRVAGHTETVLVTGETGTGKELVARTIHESSYRHKNATGRYQLRRAARTSGGERTVRLREGSLQRRRFLEARLV